MHWRVAWAFYALFVVYGSLVPLDFRPLPPGEAWARFQQIPFLNLDVGSRADWIANGVLYAPLGFLGAWAWLRGGWRAWVALPATLLLCAGLAVGVEFAQLFFPPRTVSLNDLLAEGIGAVVGALAATLFWSRRRPGAGVAVGSWLRQHGLAVYVAAYAAFCLFPYDVLVSAPELAHKLAGDGWGWWLAGSARGPGMVGLQLAVELALTAPVGLWLARRADAARRALTLSGALAAGLALGVAVELAQLFIASGVSQGASVLTRGAGMVLGLVWWQRRDRWGLAGLRAALGRRLALAAAAYLLLLAMVNGGFSAGWRGVDAAAQTWSALRLLPFYYHYYTSEAVALFSAASVALMYLPVGVLVWAARRSAGVAAAAALLAAVGVEVGKLFLAGQRPDPTNLLIAAAAAAAWVWAAEAASAPPRPRGAVELPDAAPAPAGARGPATGLARVGLLLAAVLLVGHAVSAPALAVLSVGVILGGAALVWWRPVLLLVVVPALLPALDLAPWTGRFFWDEFDVLLAVCLAVAALRLAPVAADPRASPWWLAYGVLALSYLASVAVGAAPWPWPDANSFASYFSPYNALRIGKGLLWAGLFLVLARRLAAAGHDVVRTTAAGMSLGLAYVVSVVIWERLAFVGLFDFGDVYRVTGPFAAMHRGGAFIEGYIAVALPFALLRLWTAPRWPGRLGGAALVVAAGYAMAVTFSRGGYAAFAVALVAFLALALKADARAGRRAGVWRRGVVAAMGAAAALAVALPVLFGPFATDRLARWAEDLAVRQAHWADALALRDDGAATAALGMGVGAFPQAHFWGSREAARAASLRVEPEGAAHFLRLGGGAPLYLDQIIRPGPGQPHTLSLRLRADQPNPVLDVSVCEKWMLTSRRCVAARLQGGAAPGAWATADAQLDLAALAAAGLDRWRPLKFSLHAPAPGRLVDVAAVALRDPAGRDLLANGAFGRGLDRWYFSTDVDPPWHVHSLPLAVLFDQGWFGVLAWGALLLGAVVSGLARAWRGSVGAAAALAALLAFLTVGSVNTLIDEPRFLLLLLVAAGLCRSPALCPPTKTYPAA